MTAHDPAAPAPAGNPLLEYFVRNAGRVIHKWIDYFEVYHRTLGRFRGQPITFLEIGVQNGGSLAMWRDYFGPQAKIIGVDIDPRCKALEAEGFEVWIGDQGEPAFWRGFLEKHPKLDIVIDDGGHFMAQQVTTLEALFPALANGGVYLCEDTHTSYIPSFGGGPGRPDTFLERVKRLIDEMHAWYHGPLGQHGYMAPYLYSLSIFDSIVVLEKRLKNPPLAIARGYEKHRAPPVAMTFVDLRRLYKVPDGG